MANFADQWSPTLPPELRDATLVNLCLSTPPRITENLARTADGRLFSVFWDSATALYSWSPVTEDYARRAAEPVRVYCGKADWRELFNIAPAGQTREEADGSTPEDRREPRDGNAGKSARRKADKPKRKRGRPVDPMTIQRADFARPLREQEYTWEDIYAAYRSKYPRDIDASADSIRLAFDRQNLEPK